MRAGEPERRGLSCGHRRGPNRGPPGAAWRRFLAARDDFTWAEADVAGWRVRVRRAAVTPDDAAPAVVLLAGVALSGRYLLPVAAELARRLPVWVPELPGYGRRGGPRRVPDVHELADLVVALLDRAGLERAALVGNSMGCQIAAAAAARHPDRVSHLVLDGPTVDARARTAPRQIWRLAADAVREPPSLAAVQTLDWLGTGPRRIVWAVRHALEHALEEDLPAVVCPALVVRGSRDPIVPQRWAEQVTAALPQGRLCVVPGGSHALPYHSPRILAALIAGFLTGRVVSPPRRGGGDTRR